jgi:3-phytase
MSSGRRVVFVGAFGLAAAALACGIVEQIGAGTADAGGTAGDAAGDSGQSALPVVDEAWESDAAPAEPGVEHNIDSLAVWGSGPGRAFVAVTAKEGNQLWVLDAGTGERLRTVGQPGDGPGEFRRPNGVAIVSDLAIVAERDNARIQVLRLPDFEPLGFIGEQELARPYGVAAFEGDDGIELYVTDNYMAADREGQVPRDGEQAPTDDDEQIPPDDELGRRVRHFRFRAAGDRLQSELVNTFGDTRGEGILHRVETIAADPERRRLLIVDEVELAIRVYSLEGDYVRTMGEGILAHEPEGIALYETAGGGGYWLVTDQQDVLSLFLVFDRDSLEYVGGFTGAVTANTDGVALTQLPLGAFPNGAFYAVNDDTTVTAFDWREIARVLGF